MSLYIFSVYAFFPPKMIINIESTGLSSSGALMSAGRKFDFIASTMSDLAGSYRSAECPYLASGL